MRAIQTICSKTQFYPLIFKNFKIVKTRGFCTCTCHEFNKNDILITTFLKPTALTTFHTRDQKKFFMVIEPFYRYYTNFSYNNNDKDDKNRPLYNKFEHLIKSKDMDESKKFLRQNKFCNNPQDAINFKNNLIHLTSKEVLEAERIIQQHLIRVMKSNLEMDPEQIPFIIDRYKQDSFQNYLKSDNLQEMIKIYNEEQVDVLPRNVGYLFAAYIKGDNIDGAFKLLENIYLGHFKMDGFLFQIEKYLTPRELDIAKYVLKENFVKRVKPNSRQFTAHLNQLFKSGLNIRAFSLYEKILEYGVEPNEHTYGIFLSGFFKNKKYKFWFRILNDITNRGIQSSIIIYSRLIWAFANEGRIKDAENLWYRIKRENIKLDDVIYRTMMNAYFKAKKKREAMHLFNRMLEDPEIPVNEKTYNLVIDGLFWNNSRETAFKVFEEMKKRNVLPNLITYNILIRGLLYYKNDSLVMEILQEMKQSNIQPDVITLTTLLSRFFARKDMESVKRMINNFEQYGIKPNVNTYETLIGGLVSIDDLTGAQIAYKEMINGGVSPNIKIYRMMLRLHFKQNNLNEAKENYEYIKYLKITPTLIYFKTLILGFVEARELKVAQRFYREMIAQKIKPSIPIFKILINGYIENNDLQGALKICWDVKKSDHIPHDPELKSLCREVEKVAKSSLRENRKLSF
ncbi:hypothetical protein Glove_454g11 [Diversispora epigaea]|uniref:Pentacotripeptide-repeat region of PRORP domain-containing protein n=1 Tax=Diversispora epigaea TaxID=1348612 RepID=A0A397GQU1_9GLOM|nr:hypothetical protein Glove_454g11 [Diversispora epigaea]